MYGYTGIDRHAGEWIGLYSTVVSHEDYDMMAGQLLTSEVASAPREDDLPEPCGLTSETNKENLSEAPPILKKVQESKQEVVKRVPITPSIKSTYIVPTHHVPSKPAAQKNERNILSDISTAAPGTIVRHKAYGEGMVMRIADGRIFVFFGGIEKKFPFPNAFNDGFLCKVWDVTKKLL